MNSCYRGGALLLVMTLVAGCAMHHRCAPCGGCAPASTALACTPVQRGAVVADLSHVPPYRVLRFNDRLPYCALPEREAQCLAAANSSLARSLEQEAAAIATQATCGHHNGDIGTQQQILHLRAAHERNRAAAAALQLFLRLAEAEGGVQNARQRAAEIEQMVQDVQRLQAGGFEPPLSLSSVQAQQIELTHRQVELEAVIEQLNHQLLKLLGAEPPPGTRLWPEPYLVVDPTVPNIAAAQQLALNQRADLCALRLASATNSPKTLATSRAVLASSGVGLGMSFNPCSLLACLHHGARREEAGVRQSQLASTLADEERETMLDVSESVSVIQARLTQIGLSRRRLELLQRQAARVDKAQAVDAGALFELHKAQLDRLAGEQDVLHDVIEWKRAVARLYEVQGELAIQCGFTAGAECAVQRCSR